MDKQKGSPRFAGEVGLAPILIILLIALVVGGYLVYQKQTKPVVPQPVTQSAPNPVTSPVASSSAETANWKTYTNNKYNFSFQYPTEWELKDITEESMATGIGLNNINTYTFLKDWLNQNKYFGETRTVLTLLESDNQKSPVVPKKVTEMFISGLRLEIKTVTNEQLKWEMEYLPKESFKKEEKLVNGVKVLKITTKHNWYGAGLRDFSTAVFNRNGYFYKLSNDSPGKGEGNNQFDQILSTFKFLP